MVGRRISLFKGAKSMADLADVTLKNLAVDQLIFYDAATATWENRDKSEIGFATTEMYDPQGISGDAFDRANHTGSQAISTVTNLQTTLDAKATAAALIAHENDATNPHVVTKAQVGLGNVDNTSDLDKPVSTATQTEIDSHTTDTTNPHSVTKAQVGLANVDNTSDLNKPVSTATQAALDSHTTDTTNPHSVTKTQVGLGNVDNTSDANKPISSATQTALNSKADSSSLTSHTSDVSIHRELDDTITTTTNLWSAQKITDEMVASGAGTVSSVHGRIGDVVSQSGDYTKSEVGLGNVDNTSDLNKPVSTATQTALNAKADDNAVVKLTGSQAMSGVKTFNGSISMGGEVTISNTGKILNIYPDSSIGDDSSIHLYEFTSTSGTKALKLFRGDGGSTVDAQLGVANTVSFSLSDFGVGTNNPQATLDVEGAGRFNGTLDMRNNTITNFDIDGGTL